MFTRLLTLSSERKNFFTRFLSKRLEIQRSFQASVYSKTPKKDNIHLNSNALSGIIYILLGTNIHLLYKKFNRRLNRKDISMLMCVEDFASVFLDTLASDRKLSTRPSLILVCVLLVYLADVKLW